jgi:hypothetical protein
MAQRTVTRDVPATRFRAPNSTCRRSTREARTVDLVWTTGAAVLRGGFFTEPYWEELSLDPKHVRYGSPRERRGAASQFSSQLRIEDILGVIERDALANRGPRARSLRLGRRGKTPSTRPKEGTLRNVSVGYRRYKLQEVESGDARVPTYRAIDWEPFEISLLPIGADAGAVTRSGGGI